MAARHANQRNVLSARPEGPVPPRRTSPTAARREAIIRQGSTYDQWITEIIQDPAQTAATVSLVCIHDRVNNDEGISNSTAYTTATAW